MSICCILSHCSFFSAAFSKLGLVLLPAFLASDQVNIPKVNSGEERAPQGVGVLLAPGALGGLELFNSYSVVLWRREKDGVCPESFLLCSF